MPTLAAEPGAPVHSTFAADPEYRELLELFAVGLPERQQALAAAHAQGDTAALRSLAHQLKGAGGGFGFPELTDLAAQLEFACVDRSSERVAAAYRRLADFLGRITVSG